MRIGSLDQVQSKRRKLIFQQYRIPESPDIQALRSNTTKNVASMQDDEILIRKLTFTFINLKGVINQSQQLKMKMQLITKCLDQTNSYMNSLNQLHQNSLIRTLGDQKDKIYLLINQFHTLYKITSKQQDNDIDQAVNTYYVQRQRQNKPSPSQQFKNLQKGILIYRRVLSLSQSVKYECSVFQLSTLMNYNKSDTKAVFVRSSNDSKQKIHLYNQKILAKCSTARQSKIRLSKDMQKNRLLLPQQKYLNCIQQLQHLNDPKAIEQVNFDMLNILKDFNHKFKTFSQIINFNSENLRRYQELFDSYNLMTKQVQQMDLVITSWDQLFKLLAVKDSNYANQRQLALNNANQREMILKHQNNQKNLQKNIKIYRINQNVFARYNTQTNLSVYTAKRNVFIKKLIQYQERYQKWQQQFQILIRINQFQIQIEQQTHKLMLQLSKQNTINRNDLQIKKKINALQSIDTKKNKQLTQYRNRIVEKAYEKIDNQHKKQSVDSYKNKMINQNPKIKQQIEDKINVYKRFFKQLTLIDKNKTKRFIFDNKTKLYEYVLYNQSLNEKQFFPFTVKFKLCLAIIILWSQYQTFIRHSQLNTSTMYFDYQLHYLEITNKIDQSLRQLNKVFMTHYQPDDNYEFLFGHEEFMALLINHLRDCFNIRKFQKSNSNLTPRQFYSNHYFELSQFSPQIKFFFQQFYWGNICKNLKQQSNKLQQIKPLNRLNLGASLYLDRRDFFTTQKLTQLLRNIKKQQRYKINNSLETILQIMKDIQNNLRYKNIQQKYILIVNLSLFYQYLVNINTLKLQQSYILKKLKTIVIGSLLNEQVMKTLAIDKIKYNLPQIFAIQNYWTQGYLIHNQTELNRKYSVIQRVNNLFQTLKNQTLLLLNEISAEKNKTLTFNNRIILYDINQWMDTKLIKLVNAKESLKETTKAQLRREDIIIILGLYCDVQKLNRTLQILKFNPLKSWRLNQGFLLIKLKQYQYLHNQIFQIIQKMDNNKIDQNNFMQKRKIQLENIIFSVLIQKISKKQMI